MQQVYFTLRNSRGIRTKMERDGGKNWGNDTEKRRCQNWDQLGICGNQMWLGLHVHVIICQACCYAFSICSWVTNQLYFNNFLLENGQKWILFESYRAYMLSALTETWASSSSSSWVMTAVIIARWLLKLIAAVTWHR